MSRAILLTQGESQILADVRKSEILAEGESQILAQLFVRRGGGPRTNHEKILRRRAGGVPPLTLRGGGRVR